MSRRNTILTMNTMNMQSELNRGAMDYDRYDAFLHHIFKQTQGDAWFRPGEENLSAGVALRVGYGAYLIYFILLFIISISISISSYIFFSLSIQLLFHFLLGVVRRTTPLLLNDFVVVHSP